MISMKITEHGWAVVDGDTHIAKWVEETGRIEHNAGYEERYREFVRPGDTVIDVGANIGDTTVPLARLVGPQGRVFAIEPLYKCFECLQHNVHHAKVDKQVTCLNFGAGAFEAKDVPFLESPNVGASCLAAESKTVNKYDESVSRIDIRPLDCLALDVCHFIKMDIEGYEVFAIRGLEVTIARCNPVISLEIAPHCERYGYDKAGVVAEMVARGYVPNMSLADIYNDYQPDVIFTPTSQPALLP